MRTKLACAVKPYNLSNNTRHASACKRTPAGTLRCYASEAQSFETKADRATVCSLSVITG